MIEQNMYRKNENSNKNDVKEIAKYRRNKLHSCRGFMKPAMRNPEINRFHERMVTRGKKKILNKEEIFKLQ